MYIENFNELIKNDSYTFYPVIKSACGREIIVQDQPNMINFGSCDYLGLANDTRLKQAAKGAIDEFGTNTSGAMLMSGYTYLHKNFEENLKKMFQGYHALMFTTSFLGNLGTIPSILQAGDIAILDKLSHACLVQGALLSKASIRIYKHNDMYQLEELLKEHKNTKKVVLTDGVFSADGDLANLESIVSLCEQYNAISYVDDAHGVGILGKTGCGAIEQLNLLGRVDVISGTMSKAFGSTGGFIVMKDQNIYNKIKHICSAYTGSRAVSPGVVGASLASLSVVKEEGHLRRDNALGLSQLMVSLLKDKGFNTLNTETTIIPIVFGDVNTTGKIAKELMKQKFLVSHFLPPYVEKNKARLRLGITNNHTEEDIRNFVTTLSKIV